MVKPAPKPTGQKTLFTFFKPKPADNAPPPAKPKPAAVACPASNPPPSSLELNTKISVYWPDDREWYPCRISKRFDEGKDKGKVKLLYEDGDTETVRLEDQTWKLYDNRSRKSNGAALGRSSEEGAGDKRSGDTDEEEEEKVGAATNAKRRRIMESSDESFAMDEADDDDSFKCDLDDSEEEEEFDADEEEEEAPKPKPKAAPKQAPSRPKPQLKVTELTPNASTRPQRTVTKTPAKPTRPTPINLSSKQLNPAFPQKDVVNPAGTHLHNHLSFFSNRTDLNGFTSDHPNFSVFNMKIDYKELESMSATLGTKLSPAQQQWWEIKSQYANCVLLFKTGKFYEMFHDDADIASQVLKILYMKGVLAHAGFPEAAYANMVGKLVDAGYRVARVEQTETPDGLKERKKRMSGKNKPQVVAREVCGVVTRGTRTFCYLEDVKALEDGSQVKGPLIVIKETEFSRDSSDNMDTDEDSTHAVCEYGVTIIDALTATVTLGQFADDVLRTRMQTLLASFDPTEVIVEGGENGASKTLLGLIKTACPRTSIGTIGPNDNFPKSFAVEDEARIAMVRPRQKIHPWSVKECIDELHRKGYYPRSSKNGAESGGATGRWPEVLRACIEGEADLVLSSFGAALFYLQSNLVDDEILSMGLVKAYIPPNSGSSANETSRSQTPEQLQNIYQQEARRDAGVELDHANDSGYSAEEATIDHMALDGTTLANLEILHNLSSGSYKGSLLSKIDFTKSPHGSRLLKAWLLRPLFIKAEIDRRADAVAELSTGAAAMAMREVRDLLKRTGDIERLLSRVHSMGGGGNRSGASHHPDERAIFYENEKHNKRKVEDFSKLLNGLKSAAGIPEKFDGVHIDSPLLANLVRNRDDGGLMPSDLHERLDWFFENFDLKKAAKGEFEPSPGMNEDYDAACEEIETILGELDTYKREMSSYLGQGAKHSWKYINTKEDSKDKYLIELPASVNVPDEFQVKGKRGKGQNQVNKYRVPEVEGLVQRLERAIDVKKDGKSMGMKMVFARFDDMRETWKTAMMATAMLDAIGSLAALAGQPGFCRPNIVQCPPNRKPGIKVVQGRHPCVEVTHNGSSFIPNDLTLGGNLEADDSGVSHGASILLLSGPNMGGKSTLLRQTCLITILAQIGSFVPAEECSLTPVDRIFTRLGASDRILCGQSTFFVELAETAAAVRGATRRSLVIMDELGRGTSTFDGTAIASATVKHLVERSKCLTMFATHYHSLLEDWKNDESICLGHMECMVEEDSSDNDVDKSNITFLYTLGAGPCPKSFGVNVARLAGLPDDVLRRAKNISAAFEAEMNGEVNHHKIIPASARSLVAKVESAFTSDGRLTGFDQLQDLWKSLQ